MSDDQTIMAKLNEVSDLLGALTSGRLREVLGAGRGSGAVSGCDYLCDCNHSYCGCRGSVSSSKLDQVSYPEFIAQREELLKELTSQLDRLALPPRK